jgi:hypothetical protein
MHYILIIQVSFSSLKSNWQVEVLREGLPPLTEPVVIDLIGTLEKRGQLTLDTLRMFRQQSHLTQLK